MNEESGKPRCWKTPVSRYCAKMTSEGWSAEQEPTAIPSSPAETWSGCQIALGSCGVVYQVEAQATLALGVEHDDVHYADCCPGERPSACAPTPLTWLREGAPVNMFLYHVKTSSSRTPDGSRSLSTITPSESMTL